MINQLYSKIKSSVTTIKSKKTVKNKKNENGKAPMPDTGFHQAGPSPCQQKQTPPLSPPASSSGGEDGRAAFHGFGDVILKAENLCFSYDDSNSFSLNGLSLEIRRGRKIAFMGANGSGKSTFFLCCNGIHRPSSGCLYFHGKPVSYEKNELLELRQKVGIVFQEPDSQLFSASVYQEISFGLLNMKIPREEARQAVEEIIERMEITPYRHKPTHALSGGQKKQVSIADILVMKPEIVIMDEPASALDPRHAALVNESVNRMTADGITVMMATHDVNYAFSWADEVVVLKDGRALRQADPLSVFSDPALLKEANLAQPSSLKLFNRLCEKGLLPRELPVPRDLDALEAYISSCCRSR